MATQSGQIMMLGNFIFSINTASYDTLNRVDEWGWETQKRLLNVPAEQFTHYGSTTIDLDGTIYTLRGYFAEGATMPTGKVVGTGQMEIVRQMANMRLPYRLTNGVGKNFGLFVITKLVLEHSFILNDGQPRKETFKIQLRSFGQDGKTGYFTINPQANAGPFDEATGMIDQQNQEAVTSAFATATTKAINNDIIAAGQPPSVATGIAAVVAQANAKNAGQLTVPFVGKTPNSMSFIESVQTATAQEAENNRIAQQQAYQAEGEGFAGFVSSLANIGQGL